VKVQNLPLQVQSSHWGPVVKPPSSGPRHFQETVQAQKRVVRHVHLEIVCMKHTEKPPSSTNMRPKPIVRLPNITKEAIAQRQAGIRNERWNISNHDYKLAKEAHTKSGEIASL